MLRREVLAPLGLLLFLTTACGGPGSGNDSDGAPSSSDIPSYYGTAKAILETHCVGCHTEGDIGPFPLDSYEAASEARAAVAAAVANGSMPPWPPNPDCSSYSNDRSLPAADKEALITWAEGGAPEGDPAEYTEPQSDEEEFSQPEDFDLTLQLPEPYTPTLSPDDYRCVIVDWTEEETRYMTAFRVFPDRRDMVHHVIAYVSTPAAADTYRSLDEQHEGQGYPCFGSPGGSTGTDAHWLASWAPGGGTRSLPQGTGIQIDPGAVIILQMHYNTLTADVQSDQSSIGLNIADSVERVGVVIPFTNYRWIFGSESMSIPAGDEYVEHSTREDLSDQILDYLGSPASLSSGDSFRLYSAGHHMHLLGTYGKSVIHRADGDEQCLLEINDWDFNWQGAYALTEPLDVHPGDEIQLECHWDNSAGNQAVVDGELQTPIDLEWGDGTRDEMCLGIYYITGL